MSGATAAWPSFTSVSGAANGQRLAVAEHAEQRLTTAGSGRWMAHSTACARTEGLRSVSSEHHACRMADSVQIFAEEPPRPEPAAAQAFGLGEQARAGRAAGDGADTGEVRRQSRAGRSGGASAAARSRA
jgi:hypothetical protein